MEKTKKLSIFILAILMAMVGLSSIVVAQDYYYTYDEGWLFGLSAAVCGVFILIWFIIFILIAIWVYRDAEKRGSSGALWLIIVILLGIIGIIIWLIVRPPIGGKPTQQAPGTGRICPACGRPIPMDAQVCPYCGKDFRQQ